MRRLIAAIALVASFSVSAGRYDESQDANGTTAGPLVIQVRLEDEAITPITARFVGRAIDMAGDQRAECLVIVLDTPGGLVDSTRQMVKDILRSEVPVVVHVAPPGGRAASAGVFITMAAHVSAMAPGTNIGAAHPVALGEAPFPVADWPDDEEDQEEPDAGRTPDEEKAINDTVAWVRALAELRNRNADWATEAVRESRSVSANVAVEQGAVDLLADDLDDLLTKIHGRQVQTPRGEVTLNTRQATIRHHQMWWGEQILATLAHPNLAVLLLVFGFYGVIFELYSPGWGVAGTLGALCLILAFLAMSILPINYVGLLLLALALALFVAEVFVTSFGALTVTGAVCLVLGGLLLVDSPAGFTGVSLNLLIPLALATAAITFVLLSSVVRTHLGAVRTGGEGLVGTRATASVDFVETEGHYVGSVRTHGETWQAVSATPVAAGQALEIVQREGLTLYVQVPEQAGPVDRSRPTDATA
ncbi:MAG: nodulation protein NfeD [Planctomycetaceae bacterium]|nr:MAG: nodulation protein NfeD [Planctomycetaceae bacterium]